MDDTMCFNFIIYFYEKRYIQCRLIIHILYMHIFHCQCVSYHQIYEQLQCRLLPGQHIFIAVSHIVYHIQILARSSCGWAYSVIDSHTIGPGFKTVLSTELPTDYYHNSIIELSFAGVCGRSGSISRSGLTQDLLMSSCVFQCDVPHQWIAQSQVGDGMGCHVLCLYHCYKQAPSRYDLSFW